MFDRSIHSQVNRMKEESQMNRTSQEAMFLILDRTRASASQVIVRGHYLKQMQTAF